MNIETELVKGLENRPINSVLAEPRKAPPTMPAKPFLGVVCGSRGSGKSSSIINLVKLYADYHFFDRVILFSPTFYNDPKLATLEDERYELVVHTDVNHDIIEDTFEDIKLEIEEYKRYEKYLKVYQRLIRAKNMETFLRKLEPEELALLQEHDFHPPDTKWKYGMPQTLLIFDDLVGNRSVYNNPSVVKFCLQHRHYLTSMIFAVQVWKNAVPRGVRNNLSLMILFTNKSIPIRKEVAEELSAYITAERFMELWDFACREPHDFFMVNFDDPKHRFRRNFNEIIKIK
jgi:hypothetical protein